jgi:inhibitor of KinA sporulation pathway (predicted exonuclease)
MRKLDKILIVDVESTCWKEEIQRPAGETSEIIEIGITEVDLDTLRIGVAESILVRPVRSKVSAFCTELTTLTQEVVDQGLTFQVACNLLRTKYKAHERTWASWGDYDRNMFVTQCNDMNLPYPFGPRHINLKNSFSIFENLDRELGMPKALKEIGVKLTGTHHRGHDDSANIAKIFAHMAKIYRRGYDYEEE